MLTESVSDPRRANWLTISSMTENLCWPEDTESSSRPSWELEAEILRLTTRLMMREKELRQVKSQLKSQTHRSQQQLSSLHRKLEEQEEQMRLLLLQKDDEMQAIVSQLLLFEAELRQEQTRIEDLLSEKDIQILKQQDEIDQLRKAVKKSESAPTPPSVPNIERETDSPTCATSDDANNNHPPTSVESVKKFLHLSSSNTAQDSDAAVKKLKEGLIRIRAIQDLTNVRPSRPEKIHQVPEIRICENLVLGEKRRVPHKTPQKMKDLKAKRINPSHKPHHHHHRSIAAGELCGQVIL